MGNSELPFSKTFLVLFGTVCLTMPLCIPLVQFTWFCDHVLSAVWCALCCLSQKFACSVAFYFIDIDVLIRPGDAQKYVSRRSFVLFSFVTWYLFRARVASFLYIFCNFQLYRPAEGRVTGWKSSVYNFVRGFLQQCLCSHVKTKLYSHAN